MLRAHTWEPVQLLDSISTGWKNVVDMTMHKDQLVSSLTGFHGDSRLDRYVSI